MKWILLALLIVWCSSALASEPEIAIPERDIALVKATDFVEVSGTNDLGGTENFTIHNAKAIGQFVQMLTSARFVAVPKSLKPDFKSKASYKVRLSSKGALQLELQIIADSVLDIPGETVFYMQSGRHSDNLLAPLLRLR